MAKEAIAATSDVANSRRGNASFPKARYCARDWEAFETAGQSCPAPCLGGPLSSYPSIKILGERLGVSGAERRSRFFVRVTEFRHSLKRCGSQIGDGYGIQFCSFSDSRGKGLLRVARQWTQRLRSGRRSKRGHLRRPTSVRGVGTRSFYSTT